MTEKKFERYILAVLGLLMIGGVSVIIYINAKHDPAKEVQPNLHVLEHSSDLNVYHDDKRGVTCYEGSRGMFCFLDDEMAIQHDSATDMRKWLDQHKKEEAGH